MTIQGVILAGGRSRRFGRDKALAQMGGVPFIGIAAGLLRTVGLPPIVITQAGRDYSFLGCRVYGDLVSGTGPLGGLYTALRLFGGTSLLVLTCDMPRLGASDLRKLLASHDRESSATLFCLDQKNPEPFPGIYEPCLLEPVFKRLTNGDLSMRGLLEEIPRKRLIPVRGAGGRFVNVNQQGQLRPVMEREPS